MFAKCLKYDLKALFRKWWVLACFTLPLPTIVLLHYKTRDFSKVELPLLTILIDVLFFSLLVYLIPILASVFISYQHFYQKLFTDEKYLTFALPAKRQTLYLSKLFATFIFQSTAILIPFLIIITISPFNLSNKGNKFFPSNAFFRFLSGKTNLSLTEWTWIAEILIFFALICILINVIAFLIITVYASSQKPIRSLIIGCAIFSSFALGGIYSISTHLGLSFPSYYRIFTDYMLWPNRELIFSLMFAALILVCCIISILIAFYNISRLERRLNI